MRWSTALRASSHSSVVSQFFVKNIEDLWHLYFLSNIVVVYLFCLRNYSSSNDYIQLIHGNIENDICDIKLVSCF